MHNPHAARLTAALHAHVADVQPDARLEEVLDRAHRPGLWLIALTLTAGLLLIAHQHDDQPAQPTTRYQEA